MKKINFLDSIRQPIVTEKATILSEQNKTVFKVHSGANKNSINFFILFGSSNIYFMDNELQLLTFLALFSPEDSQARQYY